MTTPSPRQNLPIIPHGTVIDRNTAGRLGEPKSEGSSIIIVTYNSVRTIQTCLHSVLTTLDDGDEIIVVDNASLDDTRSAVEGFLRKTNRLKLIACSENTGFSRGSNIGLKESNGRTVVLLNPDTAVWPRWLEKLRRVALQPVVGACGPLSDNIGGMQSVVHYLQPGVRLNELQDRVTEMFAGQSEESGILMGMCVMFRREVLDKIGLLDENLFLGNDDLEISWRIRSNGYQLRYAKDVFVHHENHVSFRSITQAQKDTYICQSAQALRDKLEAHFGFVPTDEQVWGLKFVG